MAHIIPFRGIRYDAAKVGDPSDVVAPPYDRVYPEIQAACYERSPYNIVRITKGRAKEGDGESENVYTRAAAYLGEWLNTGILIRDPEPALYVYHQEYTFGGERLVRKGVIALGKIEAERVHAHERTLAGPKADRLNLMRATEANFGHIFMLYNDPAREADGVLGAAISGLEPLIEATDADGNAHRIWRVSDVGVIARVQAVLREKDLYIADGHHRYETAVNFMQECSAKGWKPAAPESFDVRMMTLFNVAEAGMSIRPIHRLVHGIAAFDAERFVEQASEHFIVERHASFGAMVEAVEAGRNAHTFGCVAANLFASLRLRGEADLDSLIPGGGSADSKQLDVSILHAVLLEGALGIDAAALEEQRNVTYTVKAAEGLEAVETGEEQLFFYLNPTGADEVIRVADHGEKMPQKSTDFYPKLLTGLVLSTMEIAK